MPPAGQGHGTSGEIPRPIAPRRPLHLLYGWWIGLYGWWIGSCGGCGLTMAESRRQDRAERKANRRLCPVCHLDGV